MSFVWGKKNYYAARDKLGVYFVEHTKTTCVVGGQYFTKKEECETFVRRLNDEAKRRGTSLDYSVGGVFRRDNDVI